MSDGKIVEALNIRNSESLSNIEGNGLVSSNGTEQAVELSPELAEGGKRDTTDPASEIAKKKKKNKNEDDVVESDVIQVVSETFEAETGAQALDAAYVQDMEGYSFLEGSEGSDDLSGYSLGAAEAAAGAASSSAGAAAGTAASTAASAAASAAAASGGILASVGSAVAGLSTVAQVGLATLGAAAAADAIDDDDAVAAATDLIDDLVGGGDDTPTVPTTPTTGTVLTYEGAGFTDNGDGTYTPDEAFNAYGSVGAGVVTLASDSLTEVDGTTDRIVLKINSPAEANWWGGVTLVDEYVGSDMIGDGSEAITMRVYAAQDGNLNLELEANGETAYIVNETVTQGWNDVSFDVSGADATINWHKVQMRPDALGKSGEDTKGTAATYYIDDVHFPSATIVQAPAGPAEAATVPTLNNASTDVYVATNEDGSSNGGILSNVNPQWGQQGSAAIEVHPNAGAVIKIENLNYQGFEVTSSDVSAATSMHIDIWSQTAGTVKFFLVSDDGDSTTTEAGINLTVTAESWNSFDIDMQAFEAIDETALFQMKFDSQEGAIGGDATALTNFYVDNIYFGDQAPTIGTPPADPTTDEFLNGPTDPTTAEASVISLFSDAYDTDVTGLNFRTGWSTGGAVEDLTINNGDAVKKYNDIDFVGLETTASYDVSGMSTLNFSIYKTGTADLLVKVYDLGADDTWQGVGNGDDAEGTYTVATADIPADQWTEVSINVADLNGLTSNSNVTQLVFDIVDETETFYVDDIYYAV